MRKRIVIVMGLILLLIGCTPDDLPDEIVEEGNDDSEENDVSIVPGSQLSEQNYKMILPYRTSEARGDIVDQVANRLDIDEMEAGLRRHSTATFDPKEYYFQEGQYISEVKQWIDELRDEEELLEDNPRIFSHILEQNFLKKVDEKSSELAGVSLGIALKSIYQDGDDIKSISRKEMLNVGKDIAQTILERVRRLDEDLQSVPIVIALYWEEEAGSPTPGNFVSKTVVEGSNMLIDEWEEINEKHVLFPSEDAQKNHPENSEVLNTFGEEIAEFFPNYVGYVGDAFYVNDKLQKLSIEIPIEFQGSSEVIGFTQYTYDVVKGLFSDNYDLEVKITSSQKEESVIYQEAGDEQPTVHIFH